MKINPFKIRAFNNVDKPILGSFSNWAVTAGKFPSFITQCNDKRY